MLPPMRLRRASVECLLTGGPALLILAWMLTREGGYFERSWIPATVLVLLIGAASTIALRAEIALPSRAARLAIGAFGAYVLWSFISILWASNAGDALEGSQRALLYFACFSLFALLPWTPQTVLVATLGFVGTVTLFGIVTVVRLAGDTPLDDLFIDARLRAPIGYHNASAALWTMAAVPALVLAARPEVRIWLRPPLLAATTLLLGLAVLSQSRGWLYTLPLILLAALGLTSDRRRFAVFAAFALGEVAIAAGDLLAVNSAGADLDPISAQRLIGPVLDGAVTMLVATTLAALVAGAVLVYAEQVLRRWPRPASQVRSKTTPVVARRIAALIAAAALVGAAATVITVAARGDPIGRAGDALSRFTDTREEGDAGQTHLISLGSTRYDFWRVALDAWREHPVVGLGQDNFVDRYARHRSNSFEEPRWVHSLPLRLLAHTGLVGAGLFGLFLVAAAVAVRSLWRRGRPRHDGQPDGEARAAPIAAAAAILPVAVWLAHGSVDWLWEFPALSCPALALAGAAAALARDAPQTPPAATVPAATEPAAREPGQPRSPRAQQVIVAGAIAVLLAGTLVTVPSLVADSAVSEAARSWRSDPSGALERLERARALNPLAARPWQVEGQIQAGRNRPQAARMAFAQAARKQPDAWYPYFAQGLLTNATRDRAAARRLLAQARTRNPRESLVADALRRLDTAPMTFDEAVQRIDERRDVRRNIE